MNQRLAQEAAAAGENEKQIKEVAENIANDKSVPFIIGAFLCLNVERACHA